MRVAIPSAGAGLQAAFDDRFGRAAGFVILDTEGDGMEYLDNSHNQQAGHGAAIQAVQDLLAHGVQSVLAGHFGPKATQALAVASIAAYVCQAGTVEQAWHAFKANQLHRLDSVEGSHR